MLEEEPAEPTSSSAPSPESLVSKAERLKSHALAVGATRLIQESRFLREQSERVMEEADKLKAKPKSRERPKKG
jgi:hypothetical protein